MKKHFIIFIIASLSIAGVFAQDFEKRPCQDQVVSKGSDVSVIIF
jgi:hypothetical protein